MDINTPKYKKAFREYLRRGTPLDLLLKEEEHVTTHYIWHTRGDDKVRPSHAANNGKIFSWDNPPETGNPGEEYGCRCWAEDYYGLVATESGRDVIIINPDGSIEKRIGGSRSWRNNNPGNIRYGTFAIRNGAIGEAGGFAVFPDEETGNQASKNLLRTETYSSITVDEAISRRSPSNENDTENLQNLIHQISGLSGDEIVGELSEEEFDKFAEAIRRTEGWIEGTIVR